MALKKRKQVECLISDTYVFTAMEWSRAKAKG
ncbi:hypothetical protein DFO67_1337 [Modicisalibacter xianhensis]|uniref:Uncharacterized protein n=1 Tax=Modicisalibacter xianhensis TaxID=442341 RepID=A0A4R8F8C2_9GAMM|nr:hypothetical protein DFO67_1337 [Halomonas xianhensis]